VTGPDGSPVGRRTPHEPRTIDLVIGGPIDRAEIPALCERVRVALERSGAELVRCDVSALVDPDAVTVDALARVSLIARRLGGRVWLRQACGALRDLLAFVGLGVVLPCGPVSAPEPWRQAEQREEGRRVEEEADPGDPTA
jgi:ABC-type transporter Mla MlaB component